jgi:crotonobetainyl-CoA:carnitine CoA-transferase CaiB-like acyl-CoA transferase
MDGVRSPRVSICGIHSRRVPAEEDGVLFRFLNTSKRSVALDWTTTAGRAGLLELADAADVVVESLGAAAGLDWPAVAARSPATSLLSISWFGRSGPWADRPATEFTLQAWAGSTALRGTRDRPPLAAGGRLGEWLGGGYAAIGALAGRDGNHGPEAVPQNLYACRGDEQWLALAVATDAQWDALVELLGRPAWATDSGLATAAGRRTAQDGIDAEIARWSVGRDRDALVDALLERGIPAAPVLPARDAATNPQLRARGFFEAVTHPVTGTHELPGLPMRFSGLRPRWYRAPAPTLGQHNDEVLGELLGLGDDALAALRAAGVIGDRPVGL